MEQRLVGDGLHRSGPAAAKGAVDSKQSLGVGIDQAGGDRAGAVAGKERQDDAADLGDRQHGDGDLRRHGHEQGDRVALSQPQRTQAIGHPVDLPIQVAVG